MKIHLFFTARSVLAIISAYCESCLYVSARAVVGPNAARYLFVALLGNAGIFEASTALIPSSYTFYTTTLAWSFALRVIPSDSSEAWKRCLSATAAFALGAIIGWPFAIVLSFPFVLEELFIAGQRTTYSFAEGFRRLFAAALVSGIAIGLPTMLIDTLAYGRTTLAPWNIITYNILSKARGAGPELYGTEPSSYFLRVMFLSFNLLLPLALLSGPAVAVSWLCDNRRGGARKVSSLLTRLSPFYIWLGLLTSQSHKEERFLYPAYALICFNAAVCLAQLQNVAVWLSRKTLPSSFAHQAKRTISVGVWLIIGLSALLGALRSAALTQNYSAPMWVAQPFWTSEGRTILESRNITQNASSLSEVEVAKTLASMHDPVKVCFAGEWYRFSSSFFLPQGVQPEFTWSSYEHILPGHFPAEESAVDRKRADPFAARVVSLFDWVWPCKGSRVMEPDYNEFNQPEPSHLVSFEPCICRFHADRNKSDQSHPLECDYVIDLHLHHRESKQEETSPPSPTSGVSFFAYPHIWEKVECLPFLDWESSQAEPGASAVRKVEAAVSKALWLPKGIGSTRAWSDFCLLRLNTKCQAVQELKEQGKAADLSKLQNISW